MLTRGMGNADKAEGAMLTRRKGAMLTRESGQC